MTSASILLALALHPGARFLDQTQDLAPGVTWVQRTAPGPLNISVLQVDLHQPGVRVEAVLSKDRIAGNERVSQMLARKGALAAINGDVWSSNGIEQGLTIVNGQIVMAPKCRTAFGILANNVGVVERYSDTWAWNSEAIAPNRQSHPITLLNNELNDGWLNLYNDRYGLHQHILETQGHNAGTLITPTTEVVFDAQLMVRRVRRNVVRYVGNQPLIQVPFQGYVLAGRGAAANWLVQNFRVGQRGTQLRLQSTRPFSGLQQAVSGGPRILLNGQFYSDPITNPWTPPSEEFTASFKQTYYNARHPRTAAGVSADGKRLVFMTVDGRQSQFSVGVTLAELADLMREFGAWSAVNLDGGGSTTMAIRGWGVVNSPSDNALPTGGGGSERSVANGLLIFAR